MPFHKVLSTKNLALSKNTHPSSLRTQNCKSAGFTLIEILVVLTILGILIFVAAFFYINALDKGRDSRRKQDLAAIKSALMLYFQDNNKYPPFAGTQPDFASDEGDSWIPELAPDYIKKLPKDPKQSAFEPKLIKNVYAAGSNFLKTTEGGADDKYSVQQTSDGGYIVAGTTYEKSGPDNFDLMLAKYDGSGNLSWSKTVGWPNNDSAGFYGQQTTDGGYIVTGLYDTYSRAAGSPYYDLLLVKFDSSGNVTWTKTFGESGTRDDVGYSVRQTSDGGYITTGRTKWAPGTTDDLLLVKFDASGNVSWAKRAGLNYWSSGESAVQTSDGGYIVAGYTQAFGQGSADILIVKFDGSGNIAWTKTIGKTLYDSAGSIQQTSDGGYIVSGTVRDSTSNNNLFLGKLDSSGNLSWSRSIGGSGSDRGRSVIQTTEGGYIVSGSTNSFGAGATDLFLVKFDSSGNVTWAKTAGSADYDEGYSVQQTSDGGYVSVGYTYNASSNTSKLFMVKTDSNGNIAGCSQLQNASPTEYSAPTVGSPSITSITLSLPITARSPTVTSPTPVVNTLCEGVTPSPSPSVSPTPSPIPGCLNKTSVYCYIVATNKQSYTLWAQLENINDPEIYNKPSAICTDPSPPTGLNYCLKSD